MFVFYSLKIVAAPVLWACPALVNKLASSCLCMCIVDKLLVFDGKMMEDQLVRQASAGSASTVLRSVTNCALYGNTASVSKLMCFLLLTTLTNWCDAEKVECQKINNFFSTLKRKIAMIIEGAALPTSGPIKQAWFRLISTFRLASMRL